MANEILLPPLPDDVALVDSHCHLDEPRFADDQAEVMERAQAAGVATLVTIGASNGRGANHVAVELAARHASVFATVGIHPHEASLVDDALLAELEELARRPKVVAIGETGLDYYYDQSPRDVQQEVFRRFLDLARRLGLPVSIHLRDAYDDAIRILQEERGQEIGGVIHCFSGDRPTARRMLDLGFDLSFSGVVTFKNAEELRAVAREVPADRYLVETDAPFLAPMPHRGKRNEPAFVRYTAACVAEVRGERLEDVARQSTANARRCFRLPAAS